ncbi:MAG: polysaccharide deacetylase family protein [Bacteroidota bacterium]
MLNPYRLAAKAIRRVTWYIDTGEKNLYLTFDDGPTSGITQWILDLLDQHDARGTFFCQGRRVERFASRYEEILKRGHAVGNHTYSHLRGLTTCNSRYFEDIERAAKMIDSPLFRPPHGSFRASQIHRLRKDYQIIMWDVLSRDYNQRRSPKKIFRHLLHRVRPGSIVVFHDSEKAKGNLESVLPCFLKHFREKGYAFPVIPCL